MGKKTHLEGYRIYRGVTEQFDSPKEKEKNKHSLFLFFQQPDKKFYIDFTTVVVFIPLLAELL